MVAFFGPLTDVNTSFSFLVEVVILCIGKPVLKLLHIDNARIPHNIISVFCFKIFFHFHTKKRPAANH